MREILDRLFDRLEELYRYFEGMWEYRCNDTDDCCRR